MGAEARDFNAHKVEFAPIQEFPFDLFAGLQADGGRQRQWKVDIETGLLPTRANRLHFE
jgi:hypothetical protein